VLYGVLLCGSRLVTLIQPREARLQLRASDLLLMSNFITTQASFRRAESWTPLCLPRCVCARNALIVDLVPHCLRLWCPASRFTRPLNHGSLPNN
jgi:hypothetical protein